MDEEKNDLVQIKREGKTEEQEKKSDGKEETRLDKRIRNGRKGSRKKGR